MAKRYLRIDGTFDEKQVKEIEKIFKTKVNNHKEEKK